MSTKISGCGIESKIRADERVNGLASFDHEGTTWQRVYLAPGWHTKGSHIFTARTLAEAHKRLRTEVGPCDCFSCAQALEEEELARAIREDMEGA